MSAPSIVQRLRPYSVPAAVLAIVVTAIIVVPQVVLGELTTRTYAITAAASILAVGAALPYAILVALGTLPLLAVGVASFGAPQSGANGPHSLAAGPAIKHVVAGFSYVLGAAILGALGLGVQMGAGNGTEAIPTALQPAFLYLGGLFVAGPFVTLQLWRYETPITELDWRTIVGTAGLGLSIAVSPAVTYWVFGGIVS